MRKRSGLSQGFLKFAANPFCQRLGISYFPGLILVDGNRQLA